MAPAGIRHVDTSLLFLATPSKSVTYHTIRDAYQDTISSVLKKVAENKSPDMKDICIAILCPFLHNQSTTPRSILYPQLQKLIACLYKLIVITAAKESIDLDVAGGIDAEVLIVVPGPGYETAKDEDESLRTFGPIVPLRALSSTRAWDRIFVAADAAALPESQFSLEKRQREGVEVIRLPGLDTDTWVQTPEDPVHTFPSGDRRKHYDVAVGGTFDHLHIGHKLLLTMFALALDVPDSQQRVRTLTVGITGDALLKNKKYAEVLESWADRQKSVQDFLSGIMDFQERKEAARKFRVEEQNDEGPNGHAVNVWLTDTLVIKCVEIWDPFGPTITDEKISALVLSGETRSGGKAVNDKRRERGWPDLEVFEVDVLDTDEAQETDTAEDFKNKISSTELRRVQVEKARGSSKF